MVTYSRVPFDNGKKKVDILLDTDYGSPSLVAIFNLIRLRHGSKLTSLSAMSEEKVISLLQSIGIVAFHALDSTITDDQKDEAIYVLKNTRRKFSLCPRLSGPLDFEMSASYILCRILKFTTVHGWVADPDSSIYDSVKGYSHAQLLDYCNSLESSSNHLEDTKGLLNDATNQLTAYGFTSLYAEVANDDFVLLFCRERYQVLHKNGGELFILVTDEKVRQELPKVTWMVFQEPQESTIYVTSMYTPVRGQPCEPEARKWFRARLNLKEASRSEITQRSRNVGSSSMVESGESEEGIPPEGEYESDKNPELDKPADMDGTGSSAAGSSQGQSHDVSQPNSGPSETSRNEVEDKLSDQQTGNGEKGDPHEGEYDPGENTVVDKLTDMDGTGSSPKHSHDLSLESSEPSETPQNEVEDKLSDLQTGNIVKGHSHERDYERDEKQEADNSADLSTTGSSPEQDKGAQAVRPHHHHAGIDGSQEVIGNPDDKRKMLQQGHSNDETQEISEPGETSHNEGEEPSDLQPGNDQKRLPHEGEYEHDKHQEGDKSADVDAIGSSLHQEVDSVPAGVASDFLEFLTVYNDGCPDAHFEGVVEAFKQRHQPRFYVPYEFILAYNEQMALKIQENYPRICEDLKKSVVYYLKTFEVDSPNVELKITDLPEPKSVQGFLDYANSIVLHEHYDVYGIGPEALPSSDSRRMGLGYLDCIVSKFRTRKCWGGEWSEDNMKVKNNGSEFVIDCEKDYDLDPELGFLDLKRFTLTVFERLKHDGRFPPYFEEFGDDIMGINNYFVDPVKWERFLVLISNPFAFKPPLVRSSLICDVYLAANANCSGDPPRYAPFVSAKDCGDWRHIAVKHSLLNQVYEHQNARKIKKLKYLIDIWSISHWHVFKFSRYFIQHALRHTLGENFVQNAKDISILDIVLSRTIGKSIARSVRFLVIHCGIDGLFSSAWRHYVGSEYADKLICLEDGTTTSDVAQGLLENVSDDKVPGYVYAEVEVLAEQQHVSVIMINADLKQFASWLNDNGLQCAFENDFLHCGSTVLWKRSDKQGHGVRPVIVIEGPYCAHYSYTFDLLSAWLGL